MNAPTLWDAPPPYQAHSSTSKQAAEQIRPTAGTLRAKVLTLLQSEALTDEEIANRLSLSGSTARPRRIELVQAGLVESTGTKPTASGRQAQVWVAVKPTNIGQHE